MLATVGYKIDAEPTIYALEGSIAITGVLVQWFRNGLALINSAPEIETPAHAALEATGWQTREVVDATLKALKVDGGRTTDSLLMQFVSDVLNVPVVRPLAIETVSLGAAYAAGPPSATGPTWRDCAATGTGPRGGCPPWTRRPGRPSTTTGAAPARAPSTG